MYDYSNIISGGIIMRKLSLCLIGCLILTVPVFAGGIKLLETDSHTLSLYGFLKFDATYQDGGINSLVAPRFATGGDEDSTNFTAMHTRFGLKWKGPEVFDGTNVFGHLEWDLFDSSSRNQMRFRTRLAYLELRNDSMSLVAGQHWDVFAAGLPKTLLTNGFYWQTGNVGFRRAQIRYTALFDSGEFAIALADPTSTEGINSAMPVVEARYAFKWSKKGVFGLSAAWGEEDVMGESEDVIGFSLDFKVPFGESWILMGEATSGENLDIFLSRSGIGTDTTAGWLELVYSGKKLDWYLGYGTEMLDDDGLSDAALQDTTAIFMGLIHKLGSGFSYGVEITSFESDFVGLDDTEDAMQLDFAVTYSF